MVIFMSRTYEDFALPYRPSQYDLWELWALLDIPAFNVLLASGCQVWYYYEGGEGLMRKDSKKRVRMCAFCVMIISMYIGYVLTCMDNGIVVMDSKQDYLPGGFKYERRPI